jgi:beta-galactosidase
MPDYSPAARRRFQAWLERRYTTIARLNEAWAGTFWSTKYDSFAQVLIPNPLLNGEDKLSPHASLDFMRFSADTTAAFLDRQARIIRRAAGRGQWITTNYTNVCVNADPRRTRALDFASFTLYPVRGQNELGGDSFRRGAPFRLAEACAYYRPIGGVTGVMELQPGQVNWAPTNPQVQPGAIRMWIMHAFAGGCSFVCTYRYRHPLRGPEMYHDAIVGPDGVTVMRGGAEFVQALADLATLRAAWRPGAAEPAALRARRTALLWSHDNLWDLEIQPQTVSWSSWRHRNIYAAAIKSTGASLDFIGPDDDFAAYPFLVAPAWGMVSPPLAAKFRAYAEGGGHLVFSCRSGAKNELGHFHEAPWAAPLAALSGATVDFFDMLLPDGRGRVRAGSREYPWHVWADVLSPLPGSEALATYADQFYAGKAAAVTRRLGKGSVTYIGVESEEGALERELLRGVYARAGVAIDDLPRGVYLEWRAGFRIGVNYGNEAVSLPIPAGREPLLGALPLQPGAFVVWPE